MAKPRLAIVNVENRKVDIDLTTFMDALDEWYDAGYNDALADKEAISISWIKTQIEANREAGASMTVSVLQSLIGFWEAHKYEIE